MIVFLLLNIVLRIHRVVAYYVSRAIQKVELKHFMCEKLSKHSQDVPKE